MEHTFKFKGEVERYVADKGEWFFVLLSKELTDEIRERCTKNKGWARIKVDATIGKTTWSTNLFKNEECYCFVIKKDVRETEGIKVGDNLSITLSAH